MAIEIFRDLLANTDVQRTSLDRSCSGSSVFFEEFLVRKSVGIGRCEIRRRELEYRELLILTKIF